MELMLDASVVASDGKAVGKVDRLVLHPDSMDVAAIVVHQGILFTQDRIVNMETIERVADDGTVHLNITADRADGLPAFVHEQFSHASEEQMSLAKLGPMPGASGGLGRVMVASPGSGSGPAGDKDSIFDAASVPSGEMETESSLPKGTVSIDEGTDVIDSRGEKVGTVDDIIYDDSDTIAGFIVQRGLIFTHDVRVPVGWVESMTHESIRLNLGADEAERQGRIAES